MSAEAVFDPSERGRQHALKFIGKVTSEISPIFPSLSFLTLNLSEGGNSLYPRYVTEVSVRISGDHLELIERAAKELDRLCVKCDGEKTIPTHITETGTKRAFLEKISHNPKNEDLERISGYAFYIFV